MFGQFLIMLREAFEAAFITSIILAYLYKTGRGVFSKYVWYGIALAAVISISLGFTVWYTYGALAKSTKALFEGIAAWLAVGVLSSMIYWMATKGKEIKADIQRRVELIATKGAIIGLVSLSFIVVFREGIESVLFLIPFLVREPLNTVVGSSLGIVVALVLAYGIFVVGMKINIQKFFYFSSLLLALLAGGLAGYGTHELIEYLKYTGVSIGWLAEYAYVLPISADNLLHDKNVIGALFAVMFGYAVKAEWARVIVQLAYLGIMVPLIIKLYRGRI